MQENARSGLDLASLANPFNMLDLNDSIIGHVSGRSTDIGQIISGPQNAIVLTGAPSIGKSTLIRYLQLQSGREWSWRNELLGLYDELPTWTSPVSHSDLAMPDNPANAPRLLNG